jgi:hypothetical protein
MSAVEFYYAFLFVDALDIFLLSPFCFECVRKHANQGPPSNIPELLHLVGCRTMDHVGEDFIPGTAGSIPRTDRSPSQEGWGNRPNA